MSLLELLSLQTFLVKKKMLENQQLLLIFIADAQLQMTMTFMALKSN